MESQQKRLMVALALSFALTTVYTMFFMPKPPPPAPEGAAVTDTRPPSGTPPPSPSPSPSPSPEVAQKPSGQAPEVDLPPVREVTKRTGGLELTFSSQGAGVSKAPLKGEKMREQVQIGFVEGLKLLFGGKRPEGPPVDMATPVLGEPLPLSVSIAGAAPFSATARYQVQESADDKTMTFVARQSDTEITKTFQWPTDGFDFGMVVTVKNLGTQPLAGELAVHMVRAVDPNIEVKGSYLSSAGNVSHATCALGDDLFRKVPEDKVEPEHKGALKFIGIDQQYFLSALFPMEGPRDGRCTLQATPTGRTVTAYFPLSVAPGQSVTQRFGAFIGPKDVELLRTVPERLSSLGAGTAAIPASGLSSFNATAFPHLDKTVDFGMWAVICKLLLGLLKFFHGVFANWGIAIIALTVVVKLALLPLGHKAMMSAEEMKKLQPRMEELRKKYADDKERQNLEVMKLYQEAKVNPLGGCLPMLIQMPVWIALYTTLRTSYELYHEPFLGPLWADLTYKDPTYFLPLALGVTMFVTQRLQPQAMDPAQARIMNWFMPIFFTFIMLQYPAGLTLYIFTNNLLSIAQQYGLRKYLERKNASAPASEKKARKDENERQPNRKRTNP